MGSGCGLPFKVQPIDEEEVQFRAVSQKFRDRIVREVGEQRELRLAGSTRLKSVNSTADRCSNSGLIAKRAFSQHSVQSVEEERSDPQSPKNSARPTHSGRQDDGAPKAPQPLRNVSHISNGSFAGHHLVEHDGTLTVTVPGNVGEEDEKMQVLESHKLLRTRRVHKHKRGAKKILIKRKQTNIEALEAAEDDESNVFVDDSGTQGISTPLPEDERRMIVRSLQRHFLFGSLQPEERNMLIEQMFRVEHQKGDVVCQKGAKGDCCYVILSGICSVQNDSDAQVAQLAAGHIFGELAMLYDVPRTATIVAFSPKLVLSVIRGFCFRRCLATFKERCLNETLGFLNDHSIFAKLMIEEKRMFANALSPQHFELGAVLIDENISSNADWIILVKDGTVEVTDQYKNRKVLGEGSIITGQRMPYGQKAAVAKALSAVNCLTVGQTTLNRLFGNIGEVLRRSTVRSLLESVAIFQELTDKQQTIVASLFQDNSFKKGEVIVTSLADPQLVLVMDGEVAVIANDPAWDVKLDSSKGSASVTSNRQDGRDGGFDNIFPTSPTSAKSEPELELPHSVSGAGRPTALRILQCGEVFGESTFREGCRMENSCVAHTDVVVGRAGHDEVCRALRGCAEKTPPLSWIIQRNRIKEHLQGIFPFSAIYDAMLDVILEAFETVEYKPDEVITKLGDTTVGFCIVIEGEAVQRREGALLESLGKWAHFGVRQLVLHVPDPPDAEVAAAASGVVVKRLTPDKFKEICGVIFSELAKKMQYEDLHITHADIFAWNDLGFGQFGVVKRVGVRGLFGEEFALKSISKRKVIELDQQSPIRLEREILAECCHPLVVRLITTYQNEHSVYLLMENLTGGDLFTAIRDVGVLGEEHCLFWGASIVLAIEYLHSRTVMYRDLKPENVMLTDAGFVKMVDMGCCSRKVRTYTFIGTPEYLAPEVVLGKGYTQAVDWWSVGVIMYEMICGPLPFGEGCAEADSLEVFREILEKPISIPKKVSPEANDLLTCLLERSPEQRLGSSTSAWKNEVREHQYFELLQWDLILEQSTQPPYVPPNVGAAMEPTETTASLPPGVLSGLAPENVITKLRSSLDSNVMGPRPTGSQPLSANPRAIGEVEPPSFIIEDAPMSEPDEDIPDPPDPGTDVSCFEGF